MENNLPNILAPGGQPPQASPSYQSGFLTQEKVSIRHYINILTKRKWWVILFFVGMVVTVGVITLTMTPIYQASAVLQITQDNPAALVGDRDPLASLYSSETGGRFYETQYLILSSRSMAYKIMDSLQLEEHPAFKEMRESLKDKSPDQIRYYLGSQILANLEIKPLKRSYLINVAYKSEDKQLARDVVNAISKEYMKLTMNTRRQSYDMIRSWLDVELQTMANKVVEAEKKVLAYGKEKGISSFDDNKDNVVVNKYIDLNMLLTRAQAERLAKEAQHRQIKEQGSDAPVITNNVLIQKLRQDVIDQEAKLSSLGKIFDENYPQMQAERAKLKELNGRLSNEVKRMRNTVEADYAVSLRAEKFLTEAAETQKSKVGDLQDDLVQQHILKRDVQTSEQLYQALLSRMKEASIASTMVSSNVAVIDPSELPIRPFSPRKTLNLAIAGMIGLIGGIGLAFLTEHLDNSIKSAKEMEYICHIPTLGVVPFITPVDGEKRKDQESYLEILHNPRSGHAEAIRQVRTSLMLSSSVAPPVTIVITSPKPNEGKSTMAANSAVALAVNGRKVLLIDADLRKPTLHTIFGQPQEPGLSNFLTGNASFSEIIRNVNVPNLSFISAGSIPPSPTELLASEAFKDLLQESRKDFHHVIIDTPPIIEFADGRVFSNFVDGVILVLKQDVTSREAGFLATQLLLQVNARIIGGILNMSKSDRMGNYYYNYSKHYKYYSSYYSIDDKKDI